MSLQQHPGADSYTRNRHRVITTPPMDWDNCFEGRDTTRFPGRVISVISLRPHRGHPAQSPYDSNAPLPVKTEHDAADCHLNTCFFQQVEQADVSLIKGHGCKNFCNNNFGENRHVEKLQRNDTCFKSFWYHSDKRGINNVARRVDPILCIKTILFSFSRPKKD